jgi:hypothetical protein
MKRAIAISVAFILIASGFKITIDRHFCGGNLADVRLSVTGKLASCGMEQEEQQCTNNQAFDQKCCEDQITHFSLSSNYFPEYFSMLHPVTGKEIITMQTDDHIHVNSFHTDSYISNLPPGFNIKSRLTQPEICVFRI